MHDDPRQCISLRWDASFRPAAPAGGDFAGASAEAALRAIEEIHEDEASRADRELAIRLQKEEDAHAREAYAEQRRLQALRRRDQEEQLRHSHAPPPHGQGKKKKNDCLIM